MAKVKQHWEKKTPYGDYSMTKDRVSARNSRTTHTIRKARALGLIGKHAGSKSIDKLIQNIRMFEIAVDLHEKAKAARA